MTAKKVSDEEKLLAAYIEASKLITKRSIKDGLITSAALENDNNPTCRCHVQFLSKVSHLRLDRENIKGTVGISLVFGRILHHEGEVCPSISRGLLIAPTIKFFPSVLSNLHLQWNNVEKIEGLEVLSNTLRVLCLAHNKITRLEDSAPSLLALRKLGLLDLSHNQIEEVPVIPLPFPSNLVILDLRNNICQRESYQEMLLEKLPKLLNLDGEDFTDDADDSNDPESMPDKLAVGEQDSLASHIAVMTSAASDAMETTMDDIVQRSRDRVEAVLSQIRTARAAANENGPETNEKA